MVRWPSAALVLAGAAARSITAQSGHLSALERSMPASVLEPSAGALRSGLGGVWSDPTAAPRVTGAFFGIYESSYAGIRLFHGAVAFCLGPRWSLTFGSTEIRDLFDTSLTNQDPGLATLRARALWSGVDATVPLPRMSISAGLALAMDDNVGDVQNSTVARVHLRIYPFGREWLSFGARTTRAVGGSLHATAGRQVVDLVVSREIKGAAVSVGAAASRGALWRYSEMRGGYALAANVAILSRLNLGVAAGRYDVAFGVSRKEWYRSAAAGLLLARVRLNVRYTGTQVGLGSGYAVSVGYESP